MTMAPEPADEVLLNAVSQELDRMIFAWLRTHLRRAKVGRLIVIPQGFLSHLPFAAALGKDGYFIEEFEVACAPSIALAHDLAMREYELTSPISVIIGNVDTELSDSVAEVGWVAQVLDGRFMVESLTGALRPTQHP